MCCDVLLSEDWLNHEFSRDIIVVKVEEWIGSVKVTFSKDISKDNEEQEILPSNWGILSSDIHELVSEEDSEGEGGGPTPSTSLNGQTC